MRSFQSVVCSLPGYLILFSALLLVAVQFTIVLNLAGMTGGLKQNRPQFIAALLHFFAGIFLLSVFLSYTYDVLITGKPEKLHAFEWKLLSFPWLMYAALELVSVLVILWYLRRIRQYRNTRLTPDSIRQAMDLLPAGLLISDPDGTVLLANPVMTKLCRTLTGRLLNDAGRFRQSVESADPWDHLIRTPENEVWQFTGSRITLDGREYDQMTAADMTKQYRVTEALSEKNRHLKEVHARMRSVAEKERSLAATREVMTARMTVHNRMGAVLLSGKYYLDHPENVKEEELLHLLEYSSRFLLEEAEQPDKKKDILQESVETAGRIGVTVEITGKFPENDTASALIAQAIDQCAANTVRHAGGDRLSVTITENESRIEVGFTNNGRAPEVPVTETGGLAALREAVEEAGGMMAVQSEPAFLLTLAIPK